METVSKIGDCHSRYLTYVDEEKFMFQATEVTSDNMIHFQIFEIETLFSSFHVKKIFELTQTPLEQEIKGFGIDYRAMIVVLVDKPILKSGKLMSRLRVVDLETSKTILQTSLSDMEVHGRITSSLFQLVDGHFYFGN
jgi:hypothetical protein